MLVTPMCVCWQALAFVEDTLTPAVSQCLDDHNDAALLAVWDQLATGILQPAYGTSPCVCVWVIAVTCAVRSACLPF